MECLKDYVGILGCDAAESPVNEYINSLPGITTFMVAKIANSEQPTFLNVWKDVQNNTIKSYRSSVIAAFKKDHKYKIKTVSQLVDFSNIIDTDITTPAAPVWRGFTMELMFANNVWSLQSSLQAIWVDSINLYSPVAVTDLPIKLWNLQTGELLDTYSKTVVVGWNKISIGKSYQAQRIFLGYDSTAIDSVQLNIYPYSSSFAGCQSCATYIYGDNCQAYIRGFESIDLAHPTDGNAGVNIYGLSAVVSVRCQYDWIVCNNKDLFLLSWKYALGMELMKMRIYTDRFNRYTSIDLDKAKDLFADYQASFEDELTNAIMSIDINKNDCCIECEAPITKPFILP